MPHHALPVLLVAALASGLPARAQDKTPDSINDYLVDLSPGHVAANQLIGLAGSAVTNLHTPKDFIAALSGLGDPSSKNGFGLAWSPGISSVKSLGVSAADYAAVDAKPLSRLWASTTFSYAQNKKTLNGAGYAQRAAAINIVHYLKPQDDPLLVQYRAFMGVAGAGCATQSATLDKAAIALTTSVNHRQSERRRALGVAVLPITELQAIQSEFNAELQAKKVNPVGLARELKKAKEDANTPAPLSATVKGALAELDQCARTAGKLAAEKWNASRLDVVFGQGWITADAAGSPRLSLGRHATVALALEVPQGLLNLTLKRVDKELDLATITTTPGYKSSTLAAARYTYRMDEDKGKMTYALAEVSNAKSSSATTANSAFKWALGVDRQLGPGTWLEFRVGRARVPNGSAEENKALLSFKISPDTTLPKVASSGS